MYRLRSKQFKLLFILFAISLFIRLAFLAPLVSSGGAEAMDGHFYFDRAVGFQNVMIDLLRGNLPSSEDFAQAYSSTWPPMQSFVLSLGFMIFGPTLFAARLVMVVLSALSTLLVYLITLKLSDKRAALLAALIFAFYPSFIHYSLRLLSETTYIFLTLLIVYFALLTVEAPQPYRKAGFLAVLTGVLLSLATLTRSAGLLWIPTVALWIGWRSVELKKRLLLPALILISAGVTLLPWQIVLFAVEGRPIMVTDTSEFSLYLGNNPWVPEGWGTSGKIARSHMEVPAIEYSEQHGVSLNEAYRALALQEIKADPFKFFRRGFYKWRTMWSIDIQLFRYILFMASPPMNSQFISLIFFIMVISHFIYLGLAILGLFIPAPALRYRELIVVLVLAGMVVHFVTIGLPRYNLPLLAILSPAVGHAVAHLGVFKIRAAQPWGLAALASIVLVTLFIYPGARIEYSRIESSSYYLNPVKQFDQLLGFKRLVSDRLFFRTNGGDYPEEVTISIVGTDFEFAELETQTYTWKPSVETGILELVVQSRTATEPIQLQLISEQPQQSVILSLNKEVWHTWQPSAMPGIDYLWVGSADFPLNGLSRQVFSGGFLP